MAVAIAGHTASKRPTIGLVMVARLTALTVLTLIAHGACAPLDPVGRWPGAAQLCRIQMDLINKSAAAGAVRPADAYRLDVGEDGHEVLGPEAGRPAELWIFVEFKDIVLQLAARHGVVLLGDGERDADGDGVAAALNDDVLYSWPDGGKRGGTVNSYRGTDLQLKSQGMIITGPLVAEKLCGGDKVGGGVLGLVAADANILGVAVKTDRAGDTCIQSLPVAVASGEIADNLA
jgi:hypothetical protein